jgi:hypothetical protein
MSATNRGTARNSHDYYATPEWCVKLLLPHVSRNGTLLDPCSGNGAILRATTEASYSKRLSIEIQSDLAAMCRVSGYDCIVGDALCPSLTWPEADIIITNPPYSLALPFVQRSLAEMAPRGGTVAMLLRLNWLEGQGRAGFHRENPSDVLVLPKRPSFTGKGTDATGYGWFCWGPGRGGRWRIL